MKNGLLICSGTAELKNIGDYIQSLASEQYFDHIDCFVEREELSSFHCEEKVKVIMNGWFMWKPENWPPSEDVDPLFISFHITPQAAQQMLTPHGIAYLKKYAPIGCRDIGTMRLLKEHNIPTYFSGCLTLNLGKKYKAKKKKNKVVFVDPYYESSLRSKKELFHFWKILKDIYQLVKNYKIINSISKNFHYEFISGYRKISKKLDKLIQVASFYRAYSNIFSDEILQNAQYLGHTVKQSLFESDNEKLDYARRLIEIYAESSLVVTSRIHCALPCLGVETLVLFVTSDNLESTHAIRSPGRFDGILELFYTLKYTYNKVIIDDEELKKILKGKKIDSNLKPFENKPNYKVLRDRMEEICIDFVQNQKS